MRADYDSARSDALVFACVIWAAGLILTVVGLLVYIALQNYDPALSCDELGEKAYEGGETPTNLDAWNDYELICGAEPLS